MTITHNKEMNGIEIRFDGMPSNEVIEALKENGFRWSRKQKMWYAHMTDGRMTFAKSLENGVEVISKSSKDNAETFNLWELTRKDGITSHYEPKVTNKEIAERVRKFLKPRFPMVRMSINCDGWNSVNLYIKSSPFGKYSDELKAILEYCTAYLESYNKCIDFDPYGDYGSSYNFYGSEEISYDYTQTEVTEEINRICADFQKAKEEFERAEEIRKDEEAKKAMEEYRKAQEQAKRNAEIRNQNHNDVEAYANYQHYGVDYVAENLVDFHCSKCDCISEYVELDKEDECHTEPTLYTCRVRHEIRFDKTHYDMFCNMLLDDWSFIAGTGRSATDDERIGSMIDYHEMSEKERATVEIYSDDCVAIFCDGKMMFVVDAQGYDYCRYVYMVGSKTEVKMVKVSVSTVPADVIAKNNEIAKKAIGMAADIEASYGRAIDDAENDKRVIDMIEELGEYFNVGVIRALKETHNSLKIAMYKAMHKMSGCQYQFNKANLKEGQRVTIIQIGEFGGVNPQYTTINSVANHKYAQYDDAVRVEHRPKGKRSDYYTYFYKECLVYDGWLPELREDVLWDIISESNNCVMRKSKFMSFDRGQYDVVIEYYKKLGYTPIVNTYNPFAV